MDYFRDELRSGVEGGDQRYAVLNTCRAVAYAETGRLLSKVDGALWWREHHRAHWPLVAEALAAQRQGRDLGPATPEARTFVEGAMASW